MNNIKDMIDSINEENFDKAREALKTTLSDYLAGKKFLSNKEVFGDDYTNPNEEEQKLKSELEG